MSLLFVLPMMPHWLVLPIVLELEPPAESFSQTLLPWRSQCCVHGAVFGSQG